MMRATLLIAALLATTAGCTLPGPRQPAPAQARIVPPPGWRGTIGPGAPIARQWWQGFGDPQLAALVEQALAANLDIALAAERVEEARAASDLARAQRLPQVNAQLPETQGQTLGPLGAPSRAVSAQPAISASYDTDLFGRLRLADRAARAQLLASEGAADTVRLAVAAQTASAYVTLRALDHRLAIATDTLAARQEALRIARRRYETGYSARLELRQAEAEFAATQQLIPAAQLAITRQENALSLLTGTAPADIPRGLSIEQLAAPAIPDGLPADLLRRRPDLFQAEQALVAADLTLDSQRAAMLPNLALTGSVGVVFSTALADPVALYSAGASILAPLFDGGRLQAQERAATSRRDQAALGYARTALTAFREVEDALAGVTRSGEQAQAFADQAQAADGALDNASARYRAGYSAYIEQLDAQRNLLNAQLSLVQARADRLTSLIALYQAMGGGWSQAEIAALERP